MKKQLIASLIGLSVFLFPFASASASFGPFATTGDITGLQNQLVDLQSELTTLRRTVSENQIFGSTNNTQPIAGTNYALAGSGISATVGSIVLTSFTITQTGVPITSSMLSKNFYLTLEPGNNARQEIISCTGDTQNSNGTATLSNCSRGMLPFPPYTASSSYAFPHGGGTTVILSNPPQLYNELAAIGNTEAITGAWTFASSSIPQLSSDTTNAQVAANGFNLVDYNTLASTSFAGVVNGSSTIKGIYQEATTSTIALGTRIGTTGADLVLTQNTASTSPVAYNVVETNASGTLNAGILSSGTIYTVGGITIPNATSGLLFANASGTVSSTAIQPGTTGNFLQSTGSGWASVGVTVPNKVTSSSNMGFAATTTVAGVQLPTSTATTNYFVSFNFMQGNSAQTGNLYIIASSSAASTTLLTCSWASGFPVTGGYVTGNIILPGSQTQAFISLTEFNQATTTACSNIYPNLTNGFYNFNFATTTQLIVKLGWGGSVQTTSTLSVVAF